MDIDWANDFLLEEVIKIINNKNVKITWFITHETPIIEKLKKDKKYELGIHPNFLPNTTQGNSPTEILSNLKKIVPKAVSVRTHALYHSVPLLMKFQDYGLKNDSSILLYKTKNIEPHFNPSLNLYRIPYFWEDYVEMFEVNPSWDFKNNSKTSGLKIYNFHPIHIVLNSNNLDSYQKIKPEIEKIGINEKNIDKYKNEGKGARTFFLDMLEYLDKQESDNIQNIESHYSKN